MKTKFKFMCIFIGVFLSLAMNAYPVTTEILGVDSLGVPIFADSCTMSSDGSMVVFYGKSIHLDPDDTSTSKGSFIYNRDTKTIEMINEGYFDGIWVKAATPSTAYPSANGRYVIFFSRINDLWNWYVLDRVTRNIKPIPDSFSQSNPSISGDGRYVGFTSSNRIYDLLTDTYETINKDNNPISASIRQISDDGRYIHIFSSENYLVPEDYNNISDSYIYDRQQGTFDWIDKQHLNYYGSPRMSANGRYIVNAVYERLYEHTNHDDRSKLAIPRSYIIDRQTDISTLIPFEITLRLKGLSYPHFGSVEATPSPDGSYVVFEGIDNAINSSGVILLMKNVFAYDTKTGNVFKVSVGSSGNDGNGWSALRCLSRDARYVAFISNSTNLIANATTALNRFYIRDNFDKDNDGVGEPDDCNDFDTSIYMGAPEIVGDEMDQDCNGYDLTIAIKSAIYSSKTGILTVTASSALGAQANLSVTGFGPMTWDSKFNKWMLSVNSPAGFPGAITVTGIEGSLSEKTILR